MTYKTGFVLALNRCPHGIEMISLDHSDGRGVRLTGGDCCGRWTVIKEWPMSELLLSDAASEFENAAASALSARPPAEDQSHA